MPATSWTKPAAISQGTPLGAAQLNALASVPGAFAYSPAAGTVLAAGTHTLRATFTPADRTLYATASTSTTLTVNPTVYQLTVTRAAGWRHGLRRRHQVRYGGDNLPGDHGPRACSLGRRRRQRTAGYAFSRWTGDGDRARHVCTLPPGLDGRRSAAPHVHAPRPSAASGNPRRHRLDNATTTPIVTARQRAASRRPLHADGREAIRRRRESSRHQLRARQSCLLRLDACRNDSGSRPRRRHRLRLRRVDRALLGQPRGVSAGARGAASMRRELRAGRRNRRRALAPSTEPAPTSPTTSGTPLTGAPFTLSVTRPSGGTIQAAGIKCGTSGVQCSVTMPASMWLGLEATPDPGYAFTGWTGDCSGTQRGYLLTLSGPRTCGATFVAAR